MKNLNYLFFVVFVLGCTTISCEVKQNDIKQSDSSLTIAEDAQPQLPDKKGFINVLEKHLRAVSERDLTTLEITLSPKGDMILILPQSQLRTKASEFMDYHREWFQDTTWIFKTKIMMSDVQNDMGIAIVEALYSEPERDGKPYFNRMHVSYALRKMDGDWYVVKDHASSIEKSTDVSNE